MKAPILEEGYYAILIALHSTGYSYELRILNACYLAAGENML